MCAVGSRGKTDESKRGKVCVAFAVIIATIAALQGLMVNECDLSGSKQ